MELDERLILNEDDELDSFFGGANTDTSTAEAEPLNIPDEDTGPVDWKKKLDAAGSNQKAVSAIWNQFYAKTFGDEYVDDINKLGKAPRIECINLGFNETLNPFITFIKILLGKAVGEIKLNSNFIGNPITSVKYNVIHDSYSIQGNYNNTYLDEKDITTGGFLGKDNLVFLKDLYTKDPNEMSEYLHLQKVLLNRKESINHKKDDDTSVEYSATNQAGTGQEGSKIDYFNLVFKGNSDKLKGLEEIKITFKKDNIWHAGEEKNKTYDATTPPEELKTIIETIYNKVGAGNGIMFLVAKFGNAPGFDSDKALAAVPSSVSANIDLKKVAKELININSKFFINAKMNAGVLNALVTGLVDKANKA